MYHLQNSIGKNAFERSLKPFSLIKNIRSQSLNGDFKTHADQRWYNLFFISKACGRQFNASSLTSVLHHVLYSTKATVPWSHSTWVTYYTLWLWTSHFVHHPPQQPATPQGQYTQSVWPLSAICQGQSRAINKSPACWWDETVFRNGQYP